MDCLSQGMTNSPTMCQYCADLVLCPAHPTFPQAYIIHCMDDILLACSNGKELQRSYEYVITYLSEAGLQGVTEKIQMLPCMNIWAMFCTTLKCILRKSPFTKN